MFVALDEENRRVILTSHEQAQQLRNRSFHCPICKQRVLIKNGVVMPAHFAHRQRSDNEGEPESVEHLTGKSWLVTWLRLHQQAATLEYYDANIRQRADILVHRNPPKVLE
ncbi:competence protein, partial [Lacticaseibacillus rhamnosus]